MVVKGLVKNKNFDVVWVLPRQSIAEQIPPGLGIIVVLLQIDYTNFCWCSYWCLWKVGEVGGSGDEQNKKLLVFSYAMLILLYGLWIDDLASLRQFTIEWLGGESVKHWGFILSYSKNKIKFPRGIII